MSAAVLFGTDWAFEPYAWLENVPNVPIEYDRVVLTKFADVNSRGSMIIHLCFSRFCILFSQVIDKASTHEWTWSLHFRVSVNVFSAKTKRSFRKHFSSLLHNSVNNW